MTDKVKPALEKKKTIVAELVEKVEKAKAMIFVNYQGLTHHQLEAFKRELRKSEAEFVVAKNTLIKRALVSKDLKEVESHFQNPTATIFAYNDVVAPLKDLAKTIKTLKLPTIKFGFFEGKVVSESDVTKLATLPSREVLIAQVVGGMKSPLFGLHRALSWNLQKFVMTLKAIETQKSSK